MKLLGVDYIPISDIFSLKTDFSFQPKVKREFLKQHHSIYDPIGLGAPLMISQKCMLRAIFDKKIDWSDSVNNDLVQEWQKITASIDKFQVQIPRRLFTCDASLKKCTLWVFADASSQAVAVCAYMENGQSSEVSHLIRGKTKLAPKNRVLTTPKLELQSNFDCSQISGISVVRDK